MVDVKRPVVPLIQAMRERKVQVGRLFPALPNHMRDHDRQEGGDGALPDRFPRSGARPDLTGQRRNWQRPLPRKNGSATRASAARHLGEVPPERPLARAKVSRSPRCINPPHAARASAPPTLTRRTPKRGRIAERQATGRADQNIDRLRRDRCRRPRVISSRVLIPGA